MKKRLLPLLLLPLLVVSCSKSDSEDATPSNQPKEYQVEYRVTATGYTQGNIIYYDNTAKMVTEENVPYPKTYSFKRTMKTADFVSCGAFPRSGDATASATVTILLDGKTVATATDNGPDPQATASYVLP